MSEEFRSDSHPGELKPSEVRLSTFCVRLKPASAGRKSNTADRVNAESDFRFIHSIPSPPRRTPQTKDGPCRPQARPRIQS